MTAAGLAVAIPAVLAYNVFGKRVAASEAELEGFAHDLREMIVDEHAPQRCAGRTGRPALATLDMAFGRLERNPGAQPMSDINMTPLIDVMLVLLVIFMITAPLMTSSLKLDLPKTDAAQPSDAPQFITRRARHATAALLRRRGASTPRPSPRASPRRRSRIRRPRCSCAPTRRVPYGRVAELIGMVQKAGLTRIGFVTEPAAARRERGSVAGSAAVAAVARRLRRATAISASRAANVAARPAQVRFL